MFKHLLLTVGILCCWTVVAFGQAPDMFFQLHDATNLQIGDPRITLTNSGQNATTTVPALDGEICANVYATAPTTGKVVACCSCFVPSNALRTLSVWSDLLLDNPSVSPPPNALVVKLLSATGAGGPSGCNAGPATIVLVNGLVAWMTEPQPGGFGSPNVTKTQFVPGTFNVSEVLSLISQCALLHPTAHACRSCP